MAGERRTTFAKAYEMKLRCYWGFFQEHVRNMGTYSEPREPIGNLEEQIGNKEKKSLSPPPPPQT